MAFQDHFSGHAASYAKFRPRYPENLFAELAKLCECRELAWDCGTGNGQAAVGLAEHFQKVTATDASPQQIGQAELHPRVAYHVGHEGASGLPDASVDLVTVAQALHWFDRPKFFNEVRRVLKPRGVIAVWCYGLHRLGDPWDAVLHRFYAETVGPFWPPERILVDEAYRSIDFPFPELPQPECVMQQDLSLDGLLQYLGTWSATKGFERKHGFSPLPIIERELLPFWKDRQQPRRVIWPLHFRVGRRS